MRPRLAQYNLTLTGHAGTQSSRSPDVRARGTEPRVRQWTPPPRCWRRGRSRARRRRGSPLRERRRVRARACRRRPHRLRQRGRSPARLATARRDAARGARPRIFKAGSTSPTIAPAIGCSCAATARWWRTCTSPITSRWFEGQRVPLVKLEDFAALPEFGHAGYDGRAAARRPSRSPRAKAPCWRWSTPRRRESFLAARLEPAARPGPHAGQRAGRAGASRRAGSARGAAGASRRCRSAPGGTSSSTRSAQIYDETAAELWGPLLRCEAGWQWLIGRKAQDQILLAVDGRQRPRHDDSATATARTPAAASSATPSSAGRASSR